MHDSPRRSEGGATSFLSKRTAGYGARAVAATYWSIPSDPEATVAPDDGNTVTVTPSSEPEKQAFSESHATAGSSSTRGADPSETPGLKREEGGVKEGSIQDEDESMDDFLKNLLEEEDDVPSASSIKPPASPPVRTPLTEEEKAEVKRLRDLETKEKRAEITSRHTEWEKKLTKTGEEELLVLLEKIKETRKEVVENMQTEPEMFILLKLVEETGLKQVENTNKFLKKLQKDGRKNEETLSKWTKVMAKVRERLSSQVIETTSRRRPW